MKRMEKVESIFGLVLTKETGGLFEVREQDVLTERRATKFGTKYVVYEMSSGEWIYLRNTKACTYYEVLDGVSMHYEEVPGSTFNYVVGEPETVQEPIAIPEWSPEEPIVEEPVVETIDWSKVDFTELDRVSVMDFYQKGFNRAIVIENEETLCIGFSADDGDIYIPIEPVSTGELCSIVKLDDVRDLITEDTSFFGDMCKLGYKGKIFDLRNNSVKVHYNGIEVELNKNKCDKIVSDTEEESKGFLVGSNYFFVEEITTSLLNFHILRAESAVDIDDAIARNNGAYSVIYKKYISKKKTNGITNNVTGSMFDFLKY